jgi:hypothetical protein
MEGEFVPVSKPQENLGLKLPTGQVYPNFYRLDVWETAWQAPTASLDLTPTTEFPFILGDISILLS